MSFTLNKVDYFPEITRQGRVSEELQQIKDALDESADNGERFCLSGIEPGNAYNSMQQRIRAQAKRMGLKVTIRFDSDAGDLYFKATRLPQSEPVGLQAGEAKAATKTRTSRK